MLIILEIERKFLPKQLPNLDKFVSIRYERCYIKNTDDNQVRIQKKGQKYELETKIKISDIEFKKEKKTITKEQFINLKEQSVKFIIRDSYLISHNPNITIKKYYGDYEGLYRVEVEFDSIEESKQYKIPKWIGEEITSTKLANDNKLILLDRNEFLEILNCYKK